jgi:hypothetical protein
MAQDSNNNIEVLLKKGKVKKTLDKNDYFILQSWNDRNGGYKDKIEEYAIKASDVASTPTVDTNTWDMSNVAFIDGINGDDSNGVLGDGNKPFKTISKGLEFSDKIIVKSDILISDYVRIRDRVVDIWFMPNTKSYNLTFRTEGSVSTLNLYNSGNVIHTNTTFYSVANIGYLNVTGSGDFVNFQGILSYSLKTWYVHFVFNKMYDTSLNSGHVLFASTNSDFYIEGVSIKRDVRNSSEAIFNIRSNAKVRVNIEEKIQSNVRIFYFRNQSSSLYTGETKITVPEISVVESSYYYVLSAAIEIQQVSSGSIEFNIDKINRSKFSNPINDGLISMYLIGYVGDCKIDFNNTYFKDFNNSLLFNVNYYNIAYFLNFNNCHFDLLANVKFWNGLSPSSNQGTQTTTIRFENCFFELDKTYFSFENSSYYYFTNCKIKGDNPIVFELSTGANTAELFLYNTVIENTNSTNMISNYDSTKHSVGFHAVIGSLPLNAGVVDDFGGYVNNTKVKI